MEDKAQQADGPVDYKALKAWIAAQEAYEIANSRPAPLTPAQKNALVKLGRSIPANGVIARPEIGDSNWIGDLNEFKQVNGAEVEYEDAQPAFQQFSSTCILRLARSTAPLVFPSHETNGMVASPSDNNSLLLERPSFGSKKEARKYAAKCCVEWLLERDLCQPATEAQSAKAKKKKGNNTGIAALDGPRGTSPVVQKAAALCKKLGFGVPRYKIEPVPDSPEAGWWSGEVDFGRDEHKVPAGVGRVDNVYGIRAAEERMALQVLDFLLSVEKKREEQRIMMEAEDEVAFVPDVSGS